MTTHHALPPKEKLQPYYHKVYQQADRIAYRFIIGYFVLGILLSFIADTYVLAAVMGILLVLAYFTIRSLAPMSALLHFATGTILWGFGIQYLLQLNGLTEAHFIFFISLTVLLFFEDWRFLLPPVVGSILLICVIYFAREDEWVKTYFPAAQSTTLTSFLIQVMATLFYSGLCMVWSILQRAQTRASAIQAIAIEEQLVIMDANIQFADNISQGNLASEYVAHQDDKLGQSLINMRTSLLEAARREEQERFSTAGLARVGEILRQNAENLEQLSDKVIEDLVKYMRANQGSLFVMENVGTEREHLRLSACRAWERKKFEKKTIEVGQGLVGQAAIEKRTILIKKVPADYIRITSGLGEANPNCILIVPLKAENQVVGVIELASFREMAEYEIRFMEKVCESIASMLITTRNNEKNKELLETANVLTEQARAQEEEIRQNMEEMQATQEEMHRKNREIERLLSDAQSKEKLLEEKLEEIEHIKTDEKSKSEDLITYMKNYRQTLLNILDQLPHKIFLKDHEGKMALVNTVVAKAHNMSVDELIGKSDFDFVDEATATDWRNQELEIIRKGSQTYIFNESLSGETVTLKSTKMAFYIPHLNQTGLLGIQTDITELQKLKEQAGEALKK